MKKKIRNLLIIFLAGVILNLAVFGVAMASNPWIEDTWTSISYHPCPQIWNDWLNGGQGGYAHYTGGGLYRATKANSLDFYLTGQGGSGRVGYFSFNPYNGTRYWIDRNFDGTVDKYPNDNTGWGNTWNDTTPGWGPEYFYAYGSSINSHLPGGSSFWISALYDYKSEIFDENGATSAFYYTTFAVDKRAPTISCSSPVYGQILGSKNFTANGSSNDPTENVIWGGIKKLWWALYTDGGSQISGTAQEYQNNYSSMPQTQAWSRAMSLPSAYNDGKYWIVCASYDGVGNASSTLWHRIYMDLTGPNITEHTNPPSLSNNNNPAVYWTVSDPNVGGVQSNVDYGKYQVWKRSGPTLVKDWTNGTFSSGAGDTKRYVANVGPLSNGTYFIRFNGVDHLGHWGTSHDSSDFTIDATAPAVSITSPVSGIWINQSPITVSGTAENGSYVWVRDDLGTWYAYGACSGTWSKSIPLYGGDPYTDNDIQAKASDNAGNVGYSNTIIVKFDYKKPTGSININSGNAYTASTSVTLALSATDPNGSGVNNMCFSNDGSSFSSWQSYTTSKSWTLNSGDGTKYVYVKYTDKAGNICDPYSDSIILDTQAPTGTTLIAGGNTYATTTNVALTLNASDATSGLNSMCFSNNGSSYSSWESYNTAKSWTLSSGDGSKTVFTKYRDKAGLVGGPFSDTIILDTQAPTGTVLINAGATYTTTINITLSLTGTDQTSGVNSICFSADCSGWSDWEVFNTSKSRLLPYGDGAKNVYMKLRDNAGNIGGPFSDFIILDTVAPDGSVIINGGNNYTATENVALSLEANDNTSALNSMCFSTDNIGWTSWETYGTSKSLTIPAGEGEKTIYVKYKDNAGNESSPFSDTITLDQTGPTGWILICDGADYVSSRDVSLTLDSSDNLAGTLEMQFSNDGASYSSWETYATSKSWTLTEGDAVKTVYVKYRDSVGNESAPSNDTIILKTTNPAVTITDPEDGIWTNNASVTVKGKNEVNSRVYVRDEAKAWYDLGIVTTDNWVAQVDMVYNDPYQPNQIVSRAEDAVGHTTYSNYVVINYDNIVPNPPHISAPTDGLKTSKKDQLISGSCEAGSTLVVYNNSTEIARTTDTAPGTFSVSKTFQNGSYRLRTTSTDRAGNISQFSDFVQITIDDESPANCSMLINNDAQYTNKVLVSLTLESRDNLSGVGEMIISNEASFAGRDWEVFNTSKSWNLTGGDGTKTVYAKFKDGAGNQSGVVSDSIILDTIPTPPPEDIIGNPIQRLSNSARYSGSDRIMTAIEFSKLGYPRGANTVVLATRADFPDALSGSALAVKYSGPMLLTYEASCAHPGLHEADIVEIKRLGAKEVYILGTDDALSGQVEEDLKNQCNIANENIHRVGGATRYETAVEIAKLVGVSSKKIIVATGDNYPDALAASPYSGSLGIPIILTSSSLCDAAKDWVKQSGIGTSILVGQPDVVSEMVENWLKDNGARPVRIGGDNRYITACLFSTYAKGNGLSGTKIFVATGEDFPDALCAGAIAGSKKYSSPIILVRKSLIDSCVKAFIKAQKPNFAYIAGENDVIADTVMIDLNSTIASQ